MSKNLLVFVALFLVLSFGTFLVCRKYIALGINHSIYYCQTLFGSAFPHIPKELNLIIAMAGLFTLGVILLKIISTFFQLKTLQKEMTNEASLPERLQILIADIDLTGKVKLINSKKPFAFCLGLLHSKIYMSSALLETMSVLELKGILLHERYHLDNHDSLTLFIGRVTENLFPFFPIVSDLISNFRIKREINADKAAVMSLGNNDAIISALRKFLVFGAPLITSYPSFADIDTLEGRILTLTNKSLSRKFNPVNLFLSSISILVFIATAITPISASEIHRGQTDIVLVCLNSHASPNLFSLPASQIAH